jgi:hypothetical protein
MRAITQDMILFNFFENQLCSLLISLTLDSELIRDQCYDFMQK